VWDNFPDDFVLAMGHRVGDGAATSFPGWTDEPNVFHCESSHSHYLGSGGRYQTSIDATMAQLTHGTLLARQRRMGTILLIILILMLLGAIPAWPHSRNWGYGPSGGLGLVVIILLILVLTGRL
jgi:hypothetical protein